MPTYAQLQAEPWWGREIVTPELKQFEGWIRARFGLPVDATGDKGNNLHLNGSHRSQEWIANSQYCTNHTYTVQSGLTADQARHIAGCDITPNTVADMLLISQRIDEATRAGRLEEIVFWYGNLNGDTRVDGYDNIRNAVATSDSSHLWHLHLSFDRRVLRDLNAMRRASAVLTGEEDDMTPEELLNYEITGPDGPLKVAVRLIWAQIHAAAAHQATDQLLAAAAADEVRDTAALAAIQALAAAIQAGGGSVESAGIIAEVRAVGDRVRAQVTELQAQLAQVQARNVKLAAALAAAGGALDAADD